MSSTWILVAGIVIGVAVVAPFISGVEDDPSSAVEVGKDIFHKIGDTLDIWRTTTEAIAEVAEELK